MRRHLSFVLAVSLVLSACARAQEPTRSRGLTVAPAQPKAAEPAPAQPAPAEPAKVSAPEKSAPTSKGSTYALVVGVRDYYDRSFIPLPNAVNDAAELRDTLTSAHGIIPSDNVVLMTSDAPATEHLPAKSAIMAVLKTWSEMVKPEDTFIFYFAGHGILEDGELYLVPMDGFLSTIEESAIPYRRISETLAAAGVSHAISFLDACHSGGGGARGLKISGSTEFFDELEARSRQHVVLASCRAEETSQEIADKNHGAFTWYLMDGLRGRADLNTDSNIMLGEVLQYTQTAVPAWASQQNLKQNPTLMGNLDWDLLVARAGAPEKPAIAPAPGPEPAPAGISPTPQAPATEVDNTVRTAKADTISFASLSGQWTTPWLPRMQTVRGGSFRMGTTSNERKAVEDLIYRSATTTQIKPEVLRDSWRNETLIDGSSPAVEVQPFAISVYEITNAQYAEFVRETGHRPPANDKPAMDEGFGFTLWKGNTYPEWLPLDGDGQPRLRMDHLPVVNVSAADAEAYCKWLSGKTGDGYRLPTEIEWEYAAKSGKDERLYPWGEAWRAARSNAGLLLPDSWMVVANDDDGYGFWAPVNAFEPNPWGLCNMAGNVMEWATSRDGYVARGGGWRSMPADVRTSKRYRIADAGTRSVTLGFRIVRERP